MIQPSRVVKSPSAYWVSSASVGSWRSGELKGEVQQHQGRDFETEPEILAEYFPKRWNARRELASGLSTLIRSTSIALEQAGWWKPGQENLVEGGLVVGTDFHSLSVSTGYAQELASEGAQGLSPSGFLFALPSSAAAVLGILLGLKSFQSTLTEGEDSGFKALRHAIDMISIRRVERLVVSCFSVVDIKNQSALSSLNRAEKNPQRFEGLSLELATSICLSQQPMMGDSSIKIVADSPSETDPSETNFEVEIPEGLRSLAAPSLLRVVQAFENNIDYSEAGFKFIR